MSRKYYRFLLLTLSSLFVTQTVVAASFDCKKATKEIEKTICNNSQLEQSDTRLGEVYNQLYKSLSKAEATQLRKGQIAWIKQRDKKCNTNDIDCLSEYYEDRIAMLTTQLSSESSKKPVKSAAIATTVSTPQLNSQSKVLLRSIGPITFGMNVKKAETAAGITFNPDKDSSDCQILTPKGALGNDINFTVYNDDIVAVNIYSGSITTRSGVGIDTAESQLLAKYAANMQLLGTEVVDGDEFRTLAFVPKDDADKDYRIIFTISNNKVLSFSAGKLPFVKEYCAESGGNATIEDEQPEEITLLDKLQGKWQSTEDSSSVIEIADNTWTDIYDGAKDTGMHVDVMTACLDQGGTQDNNGNHLQVGGEDGFCYSVDQINDDTLVLMYLPRGNQLSYKRM